MKQHARTEQTMHPESHRAKHWPYLVAVVLIGITTALWVPLFSGRNLHPLAVYYCVSLATLAFAALWKYRKKSVSIGAGIGALAGMALFLLAHGVSLLI